MEFAFVVESMIRGCHEYKTNIKCPSVPRIHGSMCTSRYRQALDPIGAMLDWLSLLKTMVLLYIKIREDLATSYRFCLLLDLKLYVYACLKNWRVKFGEFLSIRQICQSLALQNLGLRYVIIKSQGETMHSRHIF